MGKDHTDSSRKRYMISFIIHTILYLDDEKLRNIYNFVLHIK